MRVPRSWLADFVAIPADATLQDIADAYVRIGLEPESVEEVGADLTGPIVVGRVLEFVEEPQSNGKTIRWCQVEVGDGVVNGIVCGAGNFLVGDKVVVSLPGAVLPGGFAIAARKTYGHVSSGMICSARELGMGDDHNGIIRLSELGLDPEIGSDAIALLGLRDEVIELNVLPDRGYAMSIRGAARELAHATGWAFTDRVLQQPEPAVTSGVAPTGVTIADADVADHIVLRTIVGFDPVATSPIWMQRRLQLVGVRNISLAVDVTNYVMFEYGQPLHAFDRTKLQGDIVVRHARAGEVLETLDHVSRTLVASDAVIADDRGAIALAGTMGGLETEIDDASTELVIEAAHFNPVAVAKQSRGHKLVSEASKRLERGVDADVQGPAGARAVELLLTHGGGTYVGAATADLRPQTAVIALPGGAATRLIGYDIAVADVVRSLRDIGATVVEGEPLQVTPPSWRPDLIGVAELVEEVARLTGYDRIPSVLPVAKGGTGLTQRQRLRRSLSRSLAHGGMVEVLNYPFVGAADYDALLLAADDGRRNAVRLANPLSAEAPDMRTCLMAPLLHAARRNVGRGLRDFALFEMGMVTKPAEAAAAPTPDIASRPSDEVLAEIHRAVPRQPEHVAGVFVGQRLKAGALTAGRAATWSDAVAAAVAIGRVFGVQLRVEARELMPWHPGRCAGVFVGEQRIGNAGELHPKVAANFGLPVGTAYFECNLEALYAAHPGAVAATPVRTYPVALQDLALVVPDTLPAETLRSAIAEALGDVCESVRCFDVYTGGQVPDGHRSLAFALRLRAADRTLSEDEVAGLRTLAVTAATDLGAVLR